MKKADDGFTLVETIVAAGLIGVALTFAAGSLAYFSRFESSTRFQDQAVQIANGVVERGKATPWASLSQDTTTRCPSTAALPAGGGTTDGPGVRPRTGAVLDAGLLPRAYEGRSSFGESVDFTVCTEVVWADGGDTTRTAEASGMKEVQTRVTWTYGGQPQSVQLMTRRTSTIQEADPTRRTP